MKQYIALKNKHSLYGKIGKIPETWEFLNLNSLIPLEDKTAIKMGPFGSDLKKHELLNEGEIKTLWIENIVENKLNLDYKKYITKKKYQELKNFTVKENDVVLSMMGTVGRVAIIPKDIGTAIITSHLLKITLDQKRCLPVFLQYYFLSDFARNQINRESRGIVMQGLNTGIVKSLKIALPPLKEQQKIALILSNLDKLIQKTEQIIEQTQRLKKGLIQRLLTKGIKSNKFKKTEVGNIPEEWNTDILENISLKIADRDHTTPKYVKDGIIMVSPVNFKSDENIDFEACKKITEEAHEKNRKKTDIMIGDIILHRIGAGLGRVRIVTKDMPEFSILHSLAMIRPDSKKILGSFLKWAFRTSYIQNQINDGIQSMGVPDLGLNKIFNLFFAYPNLEEQKKISLILENIQKKINIETKKRDQLNDLKKGLLQQLLTGTIRVKV